jgi:hypothetical protein
MQQGINRRFQKGKARQPELIGREDMINGAPTEPETFLPWGPQHLSIAEVLSPSTTGKDFTYLICPQDEPRAWGWARRSDVSWSRLPVKLVGQEDVVALGGLAVELALAAVFRGIPESMTVE